MQQWKQRVRQLKSETYALYLAYKDPRTPWYARLFAAVVVAYAFSPLDLIPDFIPILGLLDDLLLVPLGLILARKMIPAIVLEECRAQARANAENPRPTNWLAAAIIIIIWLLLALLGGVIIWRVVAGG